MIRTILSWLRGPLTASTEADFETHRSITPRLSTGTEQHIATLHVAADGTMEVLPSLLEGARTEADRILTIEARCYNPETRRALTRHFYGRVGSRFVREPQCLNCNHPNPAMVVAE